MKVTGKMLEEVLNSPKVAANLRRQNGVSRDYDLPNCTGYSWDGYTIFIDRDVPKRMMYRGNPVELEQFMVYRARVEKAIIDAFRHGCPVVQRVLNMQAEDQHGPAAEAADAAEALLVSMKIGGEGLGHYRAFLGGRHKEDGDPSFRRVPNNLDMTPYRDVGAQQVLKRRMLD